MKEDSRLFRADVAIPWLLFVGLLLFYLMGFQANPKYNAAAFLAWYREMPLEFHTHHPLFPYYLWSWIQIGQQLGLSAIDAATVQASLATSVAAVLYYFFFRRCKVSVEGATVFSLLYASNGTNLNNATTSELYAICLLLSVLVLHAFLSITRKGGGRMGVFLWITSLALFLFHIGYAFYILAVYLTLCWNERKKPVQAVLRLAQGALLPVIFLSWLALRGDLSGFGDHSSSFLGEYWLHGEGGVLWHLVKAPLFDFSRYAGLILFPACLGWVTLRKEIPRLALLSVLATLFSYSFFAFWAVDRGSYYLTLHPLWGLFAALGVQRILGHANRVRFMFLLGSLVAYFAAFVAVPLFLLDDSPEPFHWILSLAFLVVLAVSGWLGKQSGIGQASVSLTGYRKRWRAYALLVLALTALAYLPRYIERRNPDHITLMLRDFARYAPPDARLVTLAPAPRCEAQSERSCLSVGKMDKEKAGILSNWLIRATEGDSSPVFLGPSAYRDRTQIWQKEVNPSLNQLKFHLFRFGEHDFYRVGAAL